MSSREDRLFEVDLELAVRTYDVDFGGVVSNIVYIRWLEDLRLAILERCYPLAQLVSAGLAPTLVETHIEYRRPIRLLDRPIGRAWLSGVSAARLSFRAEIWVEAALAANASQVGCIVEMRTGRPVRVPAALAAGQPVTPDNSASGGNA